MIATSKVHNDKLVIAVLNGTIDERGLQKLASEIETKALRHGKVNLLVEVRDSGNFADFKTFTSALKTKFNAWGKIEKYAIVTDKDWLGGAVKVADFLTSDMQIKQFDLNEMAAALLWMETPDMQFNNLVLEPVTALNTIGMTINGKLTADDYDKLNLELDKLAARTDKINLLIEVIDFEGYSMGGLWKDLKTTVAHYNKFNKVAFLGKGWLKTVVNTADFVTPGVDLEFFELIDKDKAVAWLAR